MNVHRQFYGKQLVLKFNQYESLVAKGCDFVKVVKHVFIIILHLEFLPLLSMVL